MRLEQLRVSMGPPPLDVPKNVTDIVCGILDLWPDVVAEWYTREERMTAW